MYAVIDLETTGGNPGSARIIEIAIYLTDGRSWEPGLSTLVNPGMKIPPFVAQLTGISDEMVAAAPAFEEVADSIARITQDRILVAHNAGFDAGFLATEMAFSGRAYQRDRLCTLELSRRWIPEAPSHSLGKLCAFLGIELEHRHRAYGDAEATVRLLHFLMARMATAGHSLETFIKPGTPARLPAHLPVEDLQGLPFLPGVFYLHDTAGEVIYVGYGSNIRHAAWKKLVDAPSRRRNGKRMVRSTHSISYFSTGSEILAQIHGYLEKLHHQPRYNTKAFRTRDDVVVPVSVGEPPEEASLVLRYDAKATARKEINRLAQKHGWCTAGPRTWRGRCPHCRSAPCRRFGEPELPTLFLPKEDLPTLRKHWRFQQNDFLLELRGRDEAEAGLVLVRDGALVAYGWLPHDEPVESCHELESRLIPCHDSFELRRFVHQCLRQQAFCRKRILPSDVFADH